MWMNRLFNVFIRRRMIRREDVDLGERSNAAEQTFKMKLERIWCCANAVIGAEARLSLTLSEMVKPGRSPH